MGASGQRRCSSVREYRARREPGVETRGRPRGTREGEQSGPASEASSGRDMVDVVLDLYVMATGREGTEKRQQLVNMRLGDLRQSLERWQTRAKEARVRFCLSNFFTATFKLRCSKGDRPHVCRVCFCCYLHNSQVCRCSAFLQQSHPHLYVTSALAISSSRRNCHGLRRVCVCAVRVVDSDCC